MAKTWILQSICMLSMILMYVHGDLVKRSDDSHPLEAVVQQLVSDMSDLRAQMSVKDTELQAIRNELQSLKDRDNERVAFTAYISEAILPETSNGVIRFSHTITNTGGAYNSASGAFTAPYDGDYMFTVSVDVSPDYRTLTISKNGHAQVSGHNDVTGYNIVSVCVLTLVAGDTITVNHSGDVQGSVDGGPESLFAGFRVR